MTEFKNLAYQQAQDAAELMQLVSRAPIEVILESIDHNQVSVSQHEVFRNGPFHVFRCPSLQSIESVSENQSNDFHMESWDSPSFTLNYEIDDHIVQTSSNSTNPSISILEEEGLTYTGVLDDVMLNDENLSTLSSNVPSFIPSVIPPEIVPECATDLRDIDMTTIKMLLNYYQNTLVPRFTPAEVPYKSPWKTLYIPNILSTVGDIVLSGNGGNAKVSLMFSALAISAFNLEGLGTSKIGDGSKKIREWGKLGRMYRERATKRLKSSLLMLSSTQTKKEKYKDILMALLSMITICVSGLFFRIKAE